MWAASNASNFEVLSGLSEGDKIAIPGNFELKDQMRVRSAPTGMITAPHIRKICGVSDFFAAPVCFATSLSSSVVDSARAMFDAGHYAEACGTLNTEEANNSADPEVYFWLTRDANSNCASSMPQSITPSDAISLSPNNSEYHHWLGRAYGSKAEHSNWFSSVNLAKKTHAEFQSAVELDARQSSRAARSGECLNRKRRDFWAAAKTKLRRKSKRLAAIDPVQADLARKDLFADHKEWSKAEQECKAALAANPKDADEYMEVAEYYRPSRQCGSNSRSAGYGGAKWSEQPTA